MAEILFIIGMGLVIAFIGAKVLNRLGIPQLIGFMLAGIVLGTLGIVDDTLLESLSPIISLALGLIGYNIGLELRRDVFSGRLRRLTLIVIFEATAAFWIVTLLIYLVTQQLYVALMLGALSSATAPAATADVIWENKCRGPVTDSVMYILAADDLIAVILTNSAIAYALFVLDPVNNPMQTVIMTPLIMLTGSTVLGVIFGVAFIQFVNRENDRARLIELELGLIILLVGLVDVLGFNDIFAAIVFGFIVSNYVRKERREIPQVLEIIMSPVVMLFFVIIGARMDLGLFMGAAGLFVIFLASLYLIGRTFGKLAGVFIAARITKSEEAVKKYLGSCLMCQAGVALGLSYIIESQFLGLGGEAAYYGVLILSVVGASTMVLELLGPISVKWGLTKAGEIDQDGVCVYPTSYDDDKPLLSETERDKSMDSEIGEP
ncbi:MAG: cation:proton antiporter [Candidatus Thorarchaeota archaeon]